MKEKIEKAKVAVKETGKKVLNWAKNNKKKVIIGASAVGAGLAGVAIKGLVDKNKSDVVYEPETEETWDPGRDCTITFTLDETGEEIGKVGCTESYVKQMIDIAE